MSISQRCASKGGIVISGSVLEKTSTGKGNRGKMTRVMLWAAGSTLEQLTISN